MGYAQELERRMSGFSNFAISFSIICILAGGITAFPLSLSAAGGASVGYGWIVGAVFTIALGPTPAGGRGIRRSFAAVIALLGVALGQVGLWLIAREEGGTLAMGDYLTEVFGALVPAEFALAAALAWWRTG